MFGLFNLVHAAHVLQNRVQNRRPAIAATAAALLFAIAVELGIVLRSLRGRAIDGMQTTAAHVLTLIAGMAVFAGLNAIAYRVSASRFEKIDL